VYSCGEDGCVKRMDLREGSCDTILTWRSSSSTSSPSNSRITNSTIPIYSLSFNLTSTNSPKSTPNEFLICGTENYLETFDERFFFILIQKREIRELQPLLH